MAAQFYLHAVGDVRIRFVNIGRERQTAACATQGPLADGVFGLKPTGVSVLFGINDVLRQFDSPLQTERSTVYRRSVRSDLRRAHPRNASPGHRA